MEVEENMQSQPQPPALDIKSLFKDDTTDMRAKVEYQYGIYFHLRFMARGDLNKLTKECVIHKYNPTTKTREAQFDTDKLIARFCGRAVEGWSGMTPRNLQRLLPMNNVPDDQMDVEIPFSQEQLVLLVKNSAEVDAFLQQTATDVNFFNDNLENELKNSKASQNGS